MRQRFLACFVLGSLVAMASACARQADMTTSPSSTSSTSAVSALSGTWRSASGVAAGACSGITYTVTPSGATTASVTYTATCSGIAVNGSGSGSANGDTLTWTTTGTAGPCAFDLNGTAKATGTSTANVNYAGTLCGLPISGTVPVTR
jgi:hypothetical protein